MGQVVGLNGGVVVGVDEPVAAVVGMMHRLLEAAVAGRLRGIAVAAVEGGGFVGIEWASEPAARHLLAVSVGDLHHAIFASRLERAGEAEQDEPA